MGGIMDGHVEWAIINRLKAMLDEPTTTKFHVTQTFALFSSVLLWTKNRGWVAGNNAGNMNFADAADQTAHKFRQLLGNASGYATLLDMAMDVRSDHSIKQTNAATQHG